MSESRSKILRHLLTLGLALLGAALCLWLTPIENQNVQNHLAGFPDSHLPTHALRPTVLAALCFFPALCTLIYSLGCRLDRYIARQFASIFAICLAALILVWLLIDLSGVISDLRESPNTLATAAKFYAIRSPAILLLLTPYSLLLALLYSLGKLSTDREIIAMLQSGRGLIRISRPILIAGLLASLFCLALNYQWAPIAEGRKDAILDEARGIPITEATDVLFHQSDANRLWMIGSFPENYQKGEPLQNVQVTSSNPDNSLRSRLSAKTATWNPTNRSWTFTNAEIGRYQLGKPPIFETPEAPIIRNGWKETPSQLIRPGLPAAYLGLPDLTSWLLANQANGLTIDPAPYLTQWHYRWALPLACLVTVLLGAPLAVHFNRRGPGGGIFLAVVLSALMMLTSNIALSLGESGILPPALSAWLPNLLFALLGLYLFHRRLSGRPIYQTLKRLLPSPS
jgi:LPS export ABC transporter permease LptG